MAELLRIFILGLLCVLGGTAQAQSALDRCTTRDCTCRVVPTRTSTVSHDSAEVRREHIIRFNEDSFDISESQQRALNFWTRTHISNNTISITLIGYTDGCGSHGYNHQLAAQRIQQVRQTIEREIPHANVNVITRGERLSGHDPDSRIVHAIVHTNRSLTTRIDRIPADVYLIDGSGSMWSSWRSFTDIINASFKPNSTVYVSMTNNCYSGQRLNSISPGGGTEIWYSYYWVLGQMDEGQTLLVVSDFDANVPLTAREAAIIERRAREKNITVHTLR